MLGNYKNEIDPQRSKTSFRESSGKPQSAPIPLIDPSFSERCIDLMKTGHSFLSDFLNLYPDFVPIIDSQFIIEFIEYYKYSFPDYSKLYYILIQSNCNQFLNYDIISILLHKCPDSLYDLSQTLEYGGNRSHQIFVDQCGLYIITKLSINPEFLPIIGHIFHTVILNVDTFCGYLEAPLSFDDIMHGDLSNFPDLSLSNLVNNLYDSDNNDIIIELLHSFCKVFKMKVEACVMFGPIFMGHFSRNILNPTFALLTVKTLGRGIENFPFVNIHDFANFIPSLLSDDNNNDILVCAGIKLSIILARPTSVPGSGIDNLSLASPDIIPMIFEIARNGKYKLKLKALDAIGIFAKQNHNMSALCNSGLMVLLQDLFSNESSETDTDVEYALSALSIAYNVLLNALKSCGQLAPVLEIYREMLPAFENLQFHANESVSMCAQKIYFLLRPLIEEQNADE